MYGKSQIQHFFQKTMDLDLHVGNTLSFFLNKLTSEEIQNKQCYRSYYRHDHGHYAYGVWKHNNQQWTLASLVTISFKQFLQKPYKEIMPICKLWPSIRDHTVSQIFMKCSMGVFYENLSCKHEFHDNSVIGILDTISVFLVYQYEWNWA